MSARDLDEVLEIERVSFPTPWSRALFERELSIPYARAFVAREISTSQLVGYVCLWIVAQEAHVLNLAVHPQRRQRGIGGRLLRYVIDLSRESGVREITLEVRRSNYRAISLYRNLRFQPMGIRRRYYSDTGEDALIMGLHLADPDLKEENL